MENSLWKSDYNVLEVTETATNEEIRKAYLRLILKWHPDKNPSDPFRATQKFQQIQGAYDDLTRRFAQCSYSTPTFEAVYQQNNCNKDSESKSAFTRSASFTAQSRARRRRTRTKSKVRKNERSNFSWDYHYHLLEQFEWDAQYREYAPDLGMDEPNEFPARESPSILFDGPYGYAARKLKNLTRSCVDGLKNWAPEQTKIRSSVLDLVRKSSTLLDPDIWNSTSGSIVCELVSIWFNSSPVLHVKYQDCVVQDKDRQHSKNNAASRST